MITQCLNNGTVILQYGVIKIRHNKRHIKLYKSDNKVEDINTENTDDGVNV